MNSQCSELSNCKPNTCSADNNVMCEEKNCKEGYGKDAEKFFCVDQWNSGCSSSSNCQDNTCSAKDTE